MAPRFALLLLFFAACERLPDPAPKATGDKPAGDKPAEEKPAEAEAGG